MWFIIIALIVGMLLIIILYVPMQFHHWMSDGAGDGSKYIHQPLLTMVMDKFKQHSRKIHGCKGVPGNTAPIGSARGRVRCDALPSSENIHDEIIVSVVTRCRGHSGGYEKEGSDGVKHIPYYMAGTFETIRICVIEQ
ncbi:hypothetical protein M405DRAFT_878496 [Rhizopogon salebrosus TDB-379]|nr:hypothetical protein M405DRAFT_878496 [Rhizopogon salebrosus TDB-379]